MADRFPGYDVLAKRHSVSWNEKTRQVIDARLALGPEPRFFTAAEFATVAALAARLVPQQDGARRVDVAILVDDKLHRGVGDGYRQPTMPRERDAWRLGLAALDAEARQAHGQMFVALDAAEQDALITLMQRGSLHHEAWGAMPPKTFFQTRMAHDIVLAYYAHPAAWSAVGWGGPASPRGYVRMGVNERDPWEAAEAADGDIAAARRKNARVG